MAFTAHGLQNIVEANEIFDSSTRSRKITATEIYAFTSDDCNDTEQDLANQAVALGLPNIGDKSTRIPQMWCVGRRFSVEGANNFTVICDYTSHPYDDANNPSSGGSGGSEGSTPTEAPDFTVPPWMRPITWEWSSEMKEIPMRNNDGEGVEIINSAGEPYLDLTSPWPIAVLNIKKFQQSLTGSFIYNWVGSVNQGSFWGFGANEVLLDNIRANQVTIDNYKTWEVQYTFKCFSRGTARNGSNIGWYVPVPDWGRYDVSGGRLRTAEEVRGVSHWWLNGSGSFAAVNLSNAAYNYFLPYKKKDFSALNLEPR
jgi:hypothetical protein